MKSILFSILMIAPAAVIFIVFNSPIFSEYVVYMQQFILPYAFFLFFYTAVAVVYAPLNSGLMNLGSIPVLGWEAACLVNITGSLTGSIVAYFIAYKFGISFLKKVFGQSTANKISRISIKKEKSFEWVFISRSLSSTFSDWICYAAGILRIPFWQFMLASLLAQLVIAIPLFYLYHLGMESGLSYLLYLLIIVGFVFLYALRKRYFHDTEKL